MVLRALVAPAAALRKTTLHGFPVRCKWVVAACAMLAPAPVMRMTRSDPTSWVDTCWHASAIPAI
eukprot:5996592-Prorocentrum_lima.AAC.1